MGSVVRLARSCAGGRIASEMCRPPSGAEWYSLMLRDIGSAAGGWWVRPLRAKCWVRANLAFALNSTLWAPRRYRWLARRPRAVAAGGY